MNILKEKTNLSFCAAWPAVVALSADANLAVNSATRSLAVLASSSAADALANASLAALCSSDNAVTHARYFFNT